MIDFSTLTGLTTPKGVVTKIERNGVVMWAVQNKPDEPAVLEVEKITSNTYAKSTTYFNEEFIRLSITPKAADSTVKVTYGGLTKTLTFAYGLASSVFFGTFNGVSDEVETPPSGTLTIDGDYTAVAVGTFNKAKSSIYYCSCITEVISWGKIDKIPDQGFSSCKNMTRITIPASVTSIGINAFINCINLEDISVDNENEYFSANNGVLFNKDKTELVCYPSVDGNYIIPSNVVSIAPYAFNGCDQLKNVTIPESVTSIGETAFGLTVFTRTVTMLSDTPATLGSGAFNTVGNNRIKVPVGCGEIYKAADGWSTYADYIMEVS